MKGSEPSLLALCPNPIAFVKRKVENNICLEVNRGKGTVTVFKPGLMEPIANIPTSEKYYPGAGGDGFVNIHAGTPRSLTDGFFAERKVNRYIYVLDVEKLV